MSTANGLVTAGLQRAVFLDRDGVLNRAIVRDGKPFPPSSVAELEIVAGTRECLLSLKELGFLLVVVTNQPDVARGCQTIAGVEEIHAALKAELLIDDILTCYHDDSDACLCRKPAPGLLLEAARRYGIDLARSFIIGDRWRDIGAGAAAGCKTVWLRCEYRDRLPDVRPDYTAVSLEDAVAWITRAIRGRC